MNKEESLRLYAQGKENWNLWAKRMLAHREDSEVWKDKAKVDFTSHVFEEADFSGFIFPGNARFDEATFEGDAIFEKATFEGEAWFQRAVFKGNTESTGATFKGDTCFKEVTFERKAWFQGATFERSSVFGEATFKSHAGFQGATFEDTTLFGGARFEKASMFYQATFKSHATFSGVVFRGATEFRGVTFEDTTLFGGARFENNAMFEAATFKGAALFLEAIFKGAALFELSKFKHSTRFYGAIFHADANFKAIQGNSAFTMADAKFMEVPDFQQATFVQAPRLDNVKVGPQLTRRDKLKAFFIKGDSERAGRWRALRRLATQGHDHASEQLFFRGELLARRGVTDRYWHLAFWLGVFYQIFSDFGRSLIRPLLWWAAGMLVFAWIYLSHHLGSGGWWLLECIAGSSKPWVSALGLSVHKSLPAVSGFGFGDKLPQFHACLYGVESENPFRPLIPDEVAFLGVLQVLFSAVMIFLFLLAVRNHFRIR